SPAVRERVGVRVRRKKIEIRLQDLTPRIATGRVSAPWLLDGLGVAGFPVDEQQLDLLVAALREEYVAADGEILAHVAALQRERPDLLVGLTLRLLHSCGSASEGAIAAAD